MDSTNNETNYSRNKLRLEILPYIKDNINSRAEYNIVNAAENLREAYTYIESQAEAAYQQCVADNVLLNCARKLPGIILKEVIRKWILFNTGKLKDITAGHVDMVVNLLYKTVSKKIELPYSLTLEKTYEGVRAAKQRALKEKTEKIIYEDGEIRHVENFSISMENKADKEHIPDLLYTKWFDCDKINKLTL